MEIGMMIILGVNLFVIGFNIYEVIRVERKLKKISTNNLTGRAITFSELGGLIPLNFGIAGVDFIIVLFNYI